MYLRFFVPALSLALMGCNNARDTNAQDTEAQRVAEVDHTENIENNASVTGISTALELTEEQLLDADLVDVSGKDLGDVEGVVRGANGQIDRLLIEIEDTDPDRYVHVPIAGLKPVRDGDDWDLQTTMTRDDLMALEAVAR